MWKRHPKLSVVADCSSHLVLALRTGRGPSPDVHQLKDTLRGMPKSVRVKLLLGDAGYDSEENHRHIREDVGCQTLIPPWHGRPSKKPATGLFRRVMQKAFRKKPKSFGQRWQVETTFSMVKRDLGAALSARDYWSQNRELALRVLTHNIMIVAAL